MLSHEYIKQLKIELDSTPHDMKTFIVKTWAKRLEVSTATIYRYLRNEFGVQKIVKKEKIIDKELIDAIKEIKRRGLQEGKTEEELTTPRCIKILIKNNIKNAKKLTVSIVNRRLREDGFKLIFPEKEKYSKEEILFCQNIGFCQTTLKKKLSI